MPTQAAVLYLRSSKDRSDVSIDAQRRALHELAGTRGLPVVDEFADAVESGKDEDRPGWLRLIAALKAPARTWTHVLVLDTSRVARRRLISMMFEADCQKRGVQIIFKSLPEADPATDMVLRSVLQAFDEYHSLVSRAKGLAGMVENVRQGWRAGGRAPRGYRLEYHATGAMRDGAPVHKSRLVLDDAVAPSVQAYLQLRARGVPRGVAVARVGLPWPPASTHSMDWQSLTYAGHTAWGMHTDAPGEKRKPRAEWVVRRDTHPALITDEQAEAILRQVEDGVQGRRLRASPLLLTGLLVSPTGEPWHSDGCGAYRLGKGRKFAATRIEPTVLAQLHQDLASDDTVALLQQAMQAMAAGADPVDGRRIAGLERRAATLATQIARTVDLAAQVADPAPVLRRVTDLEQQRARLMDEAQQLRQRAEAAADACTITLEQIRALLGRLLREITTTAGDLRDQARLALREIIERIELDPKEKAPVLRLHYAVDTGASMATPRAGEESLVRWAVVVPMAPKKRRA